MFRSYFILSWVFIFGILMVLTAPRCPNIHEKFCSICRLSCLLTAKNMASRDVEASFWVCYSTPFFKFGSVTQHIQPYLMAFELYSVIFAVLFACGCLVLLLVVQAVLVSMRLKPKKNQSPRHGKVVLHQMPPNSRVLNVSPSCLKLETYLRMNKIPYESDYSFRMSSKGKVPWIEYNGTSVADSNFIVRFLNEEFQLDPDAHLSVEEKAIAHTMLVTLEENTYWYDL